MRAFAHTVSDRGYERARANSNGKSINFGFRLGDVSRKFGKIDRLCAAHDSRNAGRGSTIFFVPDIRDESYVKDVIRASNVMCHSNWL